jgi:hypothetical protein
MNNPQESPKTPVQEAQRQEDIAHGVVGIAGEIGKIAVGGGLATGNPAAVVVGAAAIGVSEIGKSIPKRDIKAELEDSKKKRELFDNPPSSEKALKMHRDGDISDEEYVELLARGTRL